MDSYLIDVPVKINIWIRPELQKRQWEVIKKAKPSILFIQSDGGRNDEEKRIINQNRALIDNSIDWNCTVYRFYEDENRGMYTMWEKVSSFIWQKVDRCIFTEDDQLMSVSFFSFCAELLEKYKDDERVECICGFNHLGVNNYIDSDYFFSKQGSIWGIATWRRVALHKKSLSSLNNDYIKKLLKYATRKNRVFYNRVLGYLKGDYYEGHVASSEFWIEFDMYAQNRLQIIPKYNLISNIGCTETSTHSDSYDLLPNGIKPVFGSNTFEIELPLKHPDFVIPDVKYEKKRNRIMAYNHPIIAFYRKNIRAIKLLRKKGIKSVINKMRQNDKIEN